MSRFQQRVRERLEEARRVAASGAASASGGEPSAFDAAHRAAAAEEHKRHLSRILSDVRRVFDDAVAAGDGVLRQPGAARRDPPAAAPWPVVFELVCGLAPERALRVTCDLPALRLECAWLREGRPLGPPQVIPPGAFSQVDVEQWIDHLLVADPWLEGRPPTY